MMSQAIPAFLNIAPGDAIGALFGLAAFLSVVFVWRALLLRPASLARVKALAARRAALKADITAPPRRPVPTGMMGFMRASVTWLKLLRSSRAEAIADRLAQAGWRGRDATIMFLFAKMVMPFACGALALFLLQGLGLFELESTGNLIIAVLCVLVGGYAPEIYLKNACAKRRADMVKGLPDVLDLMVISAEAGLSMDAALTRVARETARGSAALADELELTSIELGLLPERRTALENFAKRTGLAQIRALIGALIQTEKYGTPLAQALRVLATEMRDTRLMKAEEKAARLPAILTVPMIIFILPALFVVLIGPAILMTIDSLSGF